MNFDGETYKTRQEKRFFNVTKMFQVGNCFVQFEMKNLLKKVADDRDWEVIRI